MKIGYAAKTCLQTDEYMRVVIHAGGCGFGRVLGSRIKTVVGLQSGIIGV